MESPEWVTPNDFTIQIIDLFFNPKEEKEEGWEMESWEDGEDMGDDETISDLPEESLTPLLDLAEDDQGDEEDSHQVQSICLEKKYGKREMNNVGGQKNNG